MLIQQEKATMKEELSKEKDDAIAERDTYWQDVITQKQQEHQEALSNKVHTYHINFFLISTPRVLHF